MACVVVFLTLTQITWLPGLWIDMVYSVEYQERWPRKIILKICISFILTIYFVSLPFIFYPQGVNFSCFSVEEVVDVPTDALFKGKLY